MQPHSLTAETKLYGTIQEVFDFFSKPENLNKVMPTALRLNILTPLPLDMKLGSLIDYRVVLSGIPFFWRTLITHWEPPYKFIDEQLKGPYVFWHHEHSFEQKEGYTLMHDKVHFLSPGGFLEPVINKYFVEPKVKQIFAHRGEIFKQVFKP